MNIKHIQALLLRHLYPLKRDFDLLSDMLYWPLVDTVLWGVTSQWMGEGSGTIQIASGILMGLILWNVIWRSQSEVSRNLMEELWNNNLVNMFSTGLSLKEWISAALLLSIFKMAITLSVLIPAVYLLYRVNILMLGWWVVVLFIGATMTGWWVGFVSSSVVIRFGPKMQTVIWTLPGILLPFSAVFFPVGKLPALLQPIAYLIPTTYLFELMRTIVYQGTVSWESAATSLAISFGLNILYVSLAIWFFVRSFEYSRNLGLGRFSV